MCLSYSLRFQAGWSLQGCQSRSASKSDRDVVDTAIQRAPLAAYDVVDGALVRHVGVSELAPPENGMRKPIAVLKYLS